VNAKLKELRAAPLEAQLHPFGLTPKRRRELEKGLKAELPAVLRANAPAFDLDRMLARFQPMWAAAER